MALSIYMVSSSAMATSVLPSYGYNSGDDPTKFIFPACNPGGGSAPCNGCCANPDKIFKDQIRGPGKGEKALNDWILEKLWPEIQDKIRETGNKINAGVQQQAASLGSFADAQNNVNSMRALQIGGANAAKNAAPSEALCRFATLSQGLAASESNANAVKAAIVTQSQSRQLLREGSISGIDIKGEQTPGRSADKTARWKKYVSTFCDPTQSGLGQGPDGVCQVKDDTQTNMDINFARTVGNPLTLKVGVEGAVSKDVENLTALTDNLYSHDVINNAPVANQLDPSVASNISTIRRYMLMRSVMAKRSVAQNSLASVVAQKAEGSPSTAAYTVNLMKELGLNEAQAKAAVGDNPSYYAQMDALTRKMYQGPAFYINLMENPQNVGRQQAAMKSFELMQQRDIYKSMARSEMLLATLLEIYVTREQGGLNKKLVQSGD